MKQIICWLTGHDWGVRQLGMGKGVYYSLGLCHRCKRQYWIKSEAGKLRGVRFVKRNEKNK